MTYTISKEFHFSASHVLYGLPETHQCSRLHGHNYVVIVEMAADELDPATGFVLDYGELSHVKDLLDGKVDHRHLPDVFARTARWDGVSTTAENLSRWLWDQLADTIHEATDGRAALTAVGVRETPKTYAEYRPTP